jgi:hypothetical protein
MDRSWSDEDVLLCAQGMLLINEADLDERDIDNGEVKGQVAMSTGRSVNSVHKVMQNVAWVLTQRGLGSLKRGGVKPNASRLEQIERILDELGVD